MTCQWPDGRCQRDHDVTDPTNVGTGVRKSGLRAGQTFHYCRLCDRARSRGDRIGKPLAQPGVFPPRRCEWCRTNYRHRPGAESHADWRKRRYCGEECRDAALHQAAQDRAALRPPRSPLLSETELMRLRRMVGIA